MENLTIELPGTTYRAAFACKASTQEIRYNLNSIFLSAKHGEIVATDGYIMYVCPVEIAGSDDLIIDAPKIPAGVETVFIGRLDEKTVRIETVMRNGKSGPGYVAKVIDAKYPDHKKVIPVIKKGASVPDIGFGTGYLAKLAQIFGKDAGVKIQATDKNSAVIITAPGNDAVVVLMPRKVD